MWFHFVAISGSAMRHSALSWPLTRRAYLAHTLALAAAPAWAGAAQRAHQRWVVINMSLEPDSLDPTMAASAAVGEVVHYNVLEGLTRIEENGSVAPLLAQRWQMDARQRTCTLQLRQGVRFHDGTPFNAAAVRFSFERARAPGSTNKARKTLFDNIAHIATPDAHTVVLGLHHADAHLPFRLGENTAVILSPASADAAATAPVGTGPYRVQQWQRGHSITLEPASTYRHAKTLYMRGATFRFLYTPEAQAAALQGEEMDLFLHFATNSVRGLVADSRYQLLLGTSSSKGLLALNHRRAPLGDLRVRRAITHAIDREAFIRTVFEGRGTVIGSHFSPSDPGYVHLAHRYPYDPDRARALLREALGPAPLRLSLALPPPPYARLGGAGAGGRPGARRHRGGAPAAGMGAMAGRPVQGRLRHDADHPCGAAGLPDLHRPGLLLRLRQRSLPATGAAPCAIRKPARTCAPVRPATAPPGRGCGQRLAVRLAGRHRGAQGTARGVDALPHLRARHCRAALGERRRCRLSLLFNK